LGFTSSSLQDVNVNAQIAAIAIMATSFFILLYFLATTNYYRFTGSTDPLSLSLGLTSSSLQDANVNAQMAAMAISRSSFFIAFLVWVISCFSYVYRLLVIAN